MTAPELKEEVKDLKVEVKELKAEIKAEKQTFSSGMIRLFVGIVTFAIPIIVPILAATPELSSISSSYHKADLARDVYVGLLGMLGFCLLAYRGNAFIENLVASLGGIAAWAAALAPTTCDGCDPLSLPSVVHMLGGITLFLVAGHLCLFSFYKAAKTKDWIKAKRRARCYKVLGILIWTSLAISIIFGVLNFKEMMIPNTFMQTFRPIFWGEFVMLWLFCAAWTIAAKIKWITALVDEVKDKDKIDPVEQIGLKKPEPA